jgi:hypothetical protein
MMEDPSSSSSIDLKMEVVGHNYYYYFLELMEERLAALCCLVWFGPIEGIQLLHQRTFIYWGQIMYF